MSDFVNEENEGGSQWMTATLLCWKDVLCVAGPLLTWHWILNEQLFISFTCEQILLKRDIICYWDAILMESICLKQGAN